MIYEEKKILLIGVGGVGSEVLILLNELSGRCFSSEKTFRLPVTIVDDDLVEATNLPRQRLLCANDIGLPKVDIIADGGLLKYLEIEGVRGKIEEIPDSNFYRRFTTFILAVDNLEARRWLNAAVLQSLPQGSFEIWDCGVRGFRWSIRRFRFGGSDPCLECTMELLEEDRDNADRVAICSVMGKPRNIVDCIQWAISSVDSNRLPDLAAIHETALKRAKDHGIGNLHELTFDSIESLLVKSIPAVASINSLLAAQLVHYLYFHHQENGEGNNFFMGNAEDGWYFLDMKLSRDPSCAVCHLGP